MSVDSIQAALRDALLIANWSLTVSWRHAVERAGAATAYHYRCVQAFAQMRHTSPLLERAAAAARAAGRDHLAHYFAEHETEERSHWHWGSQDLEAARRFPGTTLRGESIAPSIGRMIERQYTGLASGEVADFLGYVAALESMPGRVTYWRDFAARNGLPEAAFSSPIQHAVADQGHSRDLCRVIRQRLSLDEVDSAVEEARRTIWNLRDAIDACPTRPAQ